MTVESLRKRCEDGKGYEITFLSAHVTYTLQLDTALDLHDQRTGKKMGSVSVRLDLKQGAQVSRSESVPALQDELASLQLELQSSRGSLQAPLNSQLVKGFREVGAQIDGLGALSSLLSKLEKLRPFVEVMDEVSQVLDSNLIRYPL